MVGPFIFAIVSPVDKRTADFALCIAVWLMLPVQALAALKGQNDCQKQRKEQWPGQIGIAAQMFSSVSYLSTFPGCYLQTELSLPILYIVYIKPIVK
ncbi:hypothetical protein [Selenomonas sp. GACV-9]|uniref:hypothetical protein n=1 Tax=Selenomonas sp. GACV-9 TaxID=3158782 RepID=UPI00094C595B